MALTSYTSDLNPDQATALRALLERQNFEFAEKPHTLFAARKGKLNVSVYKKGPKVLLQGKDTEDFIRNVAMNRLLRQGRLVAEPEEVERRLSAEYPPAGISPEVTFLGAPAPGRKAVVFTACNSLYLHAMGKPFVESLLDLPPDLGVHIHVVSPDERSGSVTT